MINDPIRILKEKSESPNARLNAILHLMDQFEPEHFYVLVEILNDVTDDLEVRSAVALALGKIGQKREQEKPFPKADFGIRASNQFYLDPVNEPRQDPDILPKNYESNLKSAAGRHGSNHAKKNTLDALDQQLLDALLQQMFTENITFKNYIIQALGLLGREEAAPSLIEALKDRSNTIFASAAEALGQLGEAVIPYLIDLLEHGADDARCVAAWKLGEIQAPSAIPALVYVLENQKNPEVLALSVWALGEIGTAQSGDTDVIAALNQAKQHPNSDVHTRAALALKKIARHEN